LCRLPSAEYRWVTACSLPFMDASAAAVPAQVGMRPPLSLGGPQLADIWMAARGEQPDNCAQALRQRSEAYCDTRREAGRCCRQTEPLHLQREPGETLRISPTFAPILSIIHASLRPRSCRVGSRRALSSRPRPTDPPLRVGERCGEHSAAMRLSQALELERATVYSVAWVVTPGSGAEFQRAQRGQEWGRRSLVSRRLLH